MSKTARRKVRPDLMSQSEAARELDCHRNTVLAMYVRRVLRGEHVGTLLYVNRKDVKREAAKRKLARAAEVQEQPTANAAVG